MKSHKKRAVAITSFSQILLKMDFCLGVKIYPPFFITFPEDNAFPAEAFNDLAAFITTMHNNAFQITQSLANLTTRDYITDYVQLYQGSSLFALEHLSYFIFMINSVVLGAYLNNQAVLEDIMGKSGVKIYNFISNLQY